MAFNIGRYSITAMVGSSVAAGYGLGSIRQASRIFEVGFHLVQSCCGTGLATEAARGVLEYAWHKRGSRKSMPGTIPIIAPRSESLRSSDSSLLEPRFTGQRG
jgi:Acetyltransferase (GNAT) domain